MEGPTPPTSNPMAPDPEEREIQQLLLQSKRMARLTYIFAVINQLFTFIIQAGAAGTSASSLQQYYSTRIGNGWSPTTIVWPTVLNAIAAIIIVIWSGILLIGYCFGGATEARLDQYSFWAGAIKHSLTALATAVMLGTAANPDSLEGQTCSNSPPTGINAVHFCFMQNFFQTVMLVQTWLGALMSGWAKLVDWQSKRLTKFQADHPDEMAPTMTAADANGSDRKGKE